MKRLTLLALLLLLQRPVMAFNIVLTNDDGFETPNIQALFRALVTAKHNVILSAPYSGQSGTGGQIVALRPIGPTSEASEGGLLAAGSPGVGATGIAPQQFYVDSSPVVSVLYGIDVQAQRIWGGKPDLVLSGPNEGNNLGIVTPHSGTLGATVTALNRGIPAIAVSAANGQADAAQAVAELVVELVSAVTNTRGFRLPEGVGLNVNLPPIDLTNSTSRNVRFAYTRIGRSANIGLQFFENLGDSQTAQAAGVPADLNLPGLSVAVPPSTAGYPEDRSRTSESNVLAPGVVTVSLIEGTYAAETDSERVGPRLKRLLSKYNRQRARKQSD